MKYLKGVTCALVRKKTCILKAYLTGGKYSHEELELSEFLWAMYQIYFQKYVACLTSVTEELNEDETTAFVNFSSSVNSFLGLCENPKKLSNFRIC